MDGRRALIYSRIRENRLDPSENDLTRGGRQQAVVEAMTGKLVGPWTFLRLPFIGDELAAPLTTDLSSGQLLQLGWVRFRANAAARSTAASAASRRRRRRVGADRTGGEHGRARDVHRALGTAAAAAGCDLRRRLQWELGTQLVGRRRAFFSPLSDFFSDGPESPRRRPAASAFLRPPRP